MEKIATEQRKTIHELWYNCNRYNMFMVETSEREESRHKAKNIFGTTMTVNSPNINDRYQTTDKEGSENTKKAVF